VNEEKNVKLIPRLVCAVALLLTMLVPVPGGAAQAERSIVVASTTSTQDSGLFDHLLPLFRNRSGITVKVIAQGTGQALDTARRGDADVVFVHDRDAELKFVADGEGVERRPVMYNDYVLVGPRADPARIRGTRDVTQALRAIRTARAPFISRGDRSGTHQAELRLWREAGVDIDAGREPWYRSVGQGMGAALNMASASNAYVLADRATWVRFGNKGELQVLAEGDARLFNQYGVILVNPARHPNVRQGAAREFIDYLVSEQGQADIASYRVEGQQLFHPNAKDLTR
jgi:tungstate transport system substrate-binding protein